jgi:hypothetical protein
MRFDGLTRPGPSTPFDPDPRRYIYPDSLELVGANSPYLSL